MTGIRPALTLAFGALVAAALQAQTVPTTNPLVGNAEAIRSGTALFRARCADCHGMDARGVRAPDLTAVWASGRTDPALFRTIRGGIPGTQMPAAFAARPAPVLPERLRAADPARR